MSSNQVKELRKQGKLDEAFQMALTEYDEAPLDIYRKRVLGWVYYEYAKKAAEENNLNAFLTNVQNLKNLQFPPEEVMIFDNLLWQYAKMFSALRKQGNINYQQANLLFDSLKGIYFTLPSEAFSALIEQLHKIYKNSYLYIEVMTGCLDFLRPEDFEPKEYNGNGKKIMPLAEQVYTAYSKKILQGDPKPNEFGIISYKLNKEHLSKFLPFLTQWIETHPNYTFLPYFKTKIELELLSDKKETLNTFLPFAKKKQNDFWVWQLMSEIITNKEISFACLCKALSLGSKEEFLGKLRVIFTKELINRGLFNEARTEIEKVLKEKQESNHKVPYEVQQWQQEHWYSKAQFLKNNFSLYNTYKGQAEALLYQDTPEEIVLITNANEVKKMARFIKDTSKNGYFKYDRILKSLKKGDVLKVRLEIFDEAKKTYKLLSAEKGDEADCKAIKTVEGQLRIIPSGAGFVGGVFVAKSLIEKNQWKNNQIIKAKAILSFDKNKDKWGWAVI